MSEGRCISILNSQRYTNEIITLRHYSKNDLKIENNENKIMLTLCSYDWNTEEYEDDSGCKQIKKTRIIGWCFDKDSNPVTIRVEDFLYELYLELPETNSKMVYGYAFLSAFKDWLNKPRHWLGDEENETEVQNVAGVSYVERRKLYYYQNNKKYPFIKIKFYSVNTMNNFVKIFNKTQTYPDIGRMKLNVYEGQISPIRKFLTEYNLLYSGWFDVDVREADAKISINKYEYVTISSTFKQKQINVTTNPLIMSFDIECYSANHKAMPDKDKDADVVFMISCISGRLNDKKENRKRCLIRIGSEDNDVKCDGRYIINAKDENHLLLTFQKYILDTNPDVILGYNIMNFDYPYLNAKITKIYPSDPSNTTKEWFNISRMMNGKVELKDMSWESSAVKLSGQTILKMPGRISIDLYPIIKRNTKLDDYKLESVSQQFLKRGKHPVTAQEMFDIFGSYNTYLSNNQQIPNELKMQYDRVSNYCLEDSELVFDLVVKLNTWIDLIEVSNIVGVSIMDIFTRGQQIRCLNQIYNIAKENDIVIDKRDTPSSDLKFEGGSVKDPIPGLHENTICLDFASLYPSIIQAYNICYTTLICEQNNNTHITDDMCHIVEFKNLEIEKKSKRTSDEDVENDDDNEDESDVVVFTGKYKFIKQEYMIGLLPTLVKKLVDARRNVRKELEKTDDTTVQAILDKRQLALKTSANSIFGFLGVAYGKLPLMEGAISITAMGRNLISKVGEYLTEKYNATIVYGDTDSVMVDLKIKDSRECQYWGERLSQEISGVRKGDPKPIPFNSNCNDDYLFHTEDIQGLFPSPLKMEFEKAMRLLCFKKKKYAAALIDKNGKHLLEPHKILKRGIVLARRDNTAWLRSIYLQVLMNILTLGSIDSSLTIIFHELDKLFFGHIDVKLLAISNELGSNYKNSNYFINRFAENLRTQGQIVSAGDRLIYLHCEYPDKKYVGDKLVLLSQFLADPSLYTLEKHYYLKHISSSLDQLFSIGHKSQLSSYSSYGIKNPKSKKFVSVCSPLSTLLYALDKGYSYNDAKYFICVIFGFYPKISVVS